MPPKKSKALKTTEKQTGSDQPFYSDDVGGDGEFQTGQLEIVKKPVKQKTLNSFFAKKKEDPQALKPESENKQTQKEPKKEILISSWNVNGIRSVIKNNLDKLQNYLDTKKPHILCLNETKLDINSYSKEIKDLPVFSQYLHYWNFCSSGQKGYSGVAVLSKTKPISVHYGINNEELDKEGRVITLEFKDFYIVACYTPNAGQGLKRLDYRIQQWDTAFFKYMNELKDKKCTILTGDLNVAHQKCDIHNPSDVSLQYAGFTLEERQSFTKYLEMGWVDTFRHFYPNEKKFSFWTAKFPQNRVQNKGWRLDYFVVDKENLGSVISSEINNQVYGSDHCPIELILDLVSLKKNKNKSENKEIKDIQKQQQAEIQQKKCEDESEKVLEQQEVQA